MTYEQAIELIQYVQASTVMVEKLLYYQMMLAFLMMIFCGVFLGLTVGGKGK